jgi:hypothetical protein
MKPDNYDLTFANLHTAVWVYGSYAFLFGMSCCRHAVVGNTCRAWIISLFKRPRFSAAVYLPSLITQDIAWAALMHR